MQNLAGIEAEWHNTLQEQFEAKGRRMGLGRALTDAEVSRAVGIPRTTVRFLRTTSTQKLPATQALRFSLFFDVPVEKLYKLVRVKR